MANTYQDFDNIQDILKEFYTPVIVNQAYKKAPLWAQLKKTSRGVVGKRVVIPVQLSFTEAVGARTQADYTLPDAARNEYDQAYIYMKRNYGVIKVDGFSIASAKGKGGWVDVVAQESKGASSAFGIDLDRQVMGDGSAVLGLTNAAASTNTVVVKSPGGLASDTPATKYFRKGMVVDFYDASFATKELAAARITAINTGTSTLTFSANINTEVDAADMLITRKNTRTAAVTTNSGEMMGIRGIVSDADTDVGDFQGIDRAANEEWQAYVNAVGATIISETMIQETLDAIEARTDAEPPNLILTSNTVRNKMVADAKDGYRTEKLELKYGWKGIKYFGGNVELPIMTHKWMPHTSGTATADHYMYFLSLPHIKFYTLKNIVWDTLNGGTLKGVANEDTVTAWFKMYGEMGCDCPNSMGLLTGVDTA